MWIKRNLNLHKQDYIWALKDTFSHEGFLIYDCLIEALSEQTDGKVNVKSKNYLALIKQVEFTAYSTAETIKKVIDFLCEQDIFTLDNDNFLYHKEVYDTVCNLVQMKEKMSLAGKKGAEAKKQKSLKQTENITEKPVKNIEVDKSKLEHYEGSFDTVKSEITSDSSEIILEVKTEITDKKGNQFKQIKVVSEKNRKCWKMFVEACTQYFEIIPEPPYTNKLNKKEKKALFYILNFFEEGYVNSFYEPQTFFDDSLPKVRKSTNNPEFYLSAFYNHLIKECIKVRDECRADIKDPYYETICDKFNYLQNMPEIA